ncbi:hypothetical protein QC762_401167 [Podospora pseudocomata]|uniref:Uncharacterized protein n=1 Tax=Podospora pseudocomata TaxID=2093779 RepID=A0ABR0GEM8_9PEZI|nr:hypothetical protein QC762_401167 [Podospora pseudocomata]
MIAIKFILALLALGTASVLAAPAASIKFSPRQGNEVSVFACTEARFTGECRMLPTPAEQCFNIDPAWNDVISSIQNLERDRFKCKWFEHQNCEGKEYKNQDDADLTDGNGFFDDRITSWFCERK